MPLFSIQALLTAGFLGGMSSLIAAWTPRRAYATAGIIARRSSRRSWSRSSTR